MRRTELNRDANAADASLYRLASRLDGMAAVYGQPDLKAAADTVASARAAIRRHMHPDDLAVTHGEYVPTPLKSPEQQI